MRIKLILGVVIFITSIKTLTAADYYWRAVAINNLFTNVGNWETFPGNGISPAIAPSASDDVFFPVVSNFTSINLNGGIAQNFNLTAPVIFTFTGTGNFYGDLNANSNARFSGQIYLVGNTIKDINLDPNPNTAITFFTGGTLHCNVGTINLQHNLYHNGAINIGVNTFNSNGREIIVNNNLDVNVINGDFSGSLIDVGNQFRITTNGTNNYMLTGTRIVLRSTFEDVNFITNYANHSPLRVIGGNPISFQSLTLINNKTWYGSGNPQMTMDSLIIDCNKMQLINLSAITASNLVLLKPCSIDNLSAITYNIDNVVTPASCLGSSIFYGPSTINTLSSISNTSINFNGMSFTGVGYNASVSNNLGNNWGTGVTWGAALIGQVFHWVGDAGNWEDPTKWSLLGSGGTPQLPGGCIPTFADSVVFDNNSFTTVGQLVNTQNTSAMCKSISVVDTDVEGDFNDAINIAGNADFSGANTVNSINLLGSGSHTLNSGNTLTYSGNIVFRMEGIYTLTSRMNSTGVWLHYSGSFVSNGNSINVLSWRSSRLNPNFSTRNVNIENSIIDLNGSGGAITSWVDLYFSHADLNSLLANNSTIRINRVNGRALFRRDGTPSLPNPTFNDLIFTATSGSAELTTNYTYDRYIFNNITFNSNAVNNSIQEPYNVDTLHLTAGKNYSFTSNYTYNINHINTISNACDELAVVSSSGAIQTRFYKASAPFNGNNLMINGVNANGATLNVTGGIDNGDLTNVIVSPSTGRDLYWVGDAGNWDDGTHWSIGVSGGNPAITNPNGCIPRPIDNVFFDGNSFTTVGQTVNLNIDGNCKNITWDINAASFSPIFTGGTTINLNIYGSLEISDGVTHNHTGSTFLRGTDTAAFSQIIKTDNVLFRSSLRPAGGGRYDFISTHFQTGNNAGLYPVNPGGYVVTNGYDMRFAIISVGLSNVNKLNINNSLIEVYSFFGGGTSAVINGINSNNFFSNDTTFFLMTASATWAPAYLSLNSLVSDTINIGGVTFAPIGIGTLNTNSFFKFKKIEFTQNNSSILGTGTVITDTLIFAQSTINTITANKTVLVNDTLIAFGTPCVPIEIRSSSVGTSAIMESGACNFNVQFASLRDITASTVNGCSVIDYQVIGSDAGGSTNWTFNSVASLTQLGTDTIVYCTNAPYTISTSGFGSVPATYLWNTGDITPTIQVDTSGIYSVNVNYASGCNVIDTVVVTIMDTVAPVLNCPLDSTVYLNGICQYILGDFTDSVAVDDCTPDSALILTQLPLPGTVYSGESLQTIWIYAEDNYGNIDSCSFQLTLLDTLNPIVTCKDTTVYLNALGTYSIDTSYVFVSANDNCGVDSIWITPTNYTCADTGVNTVTVYVRDVNNNIDSCIANVTVLDTIPPTVICNDTSVYLDVTGQYVIDTSYVFTSASDNCIIDSVWINTTDTLFTCSDVGINTVTVYVRDNNNNVDSCIANVTVIDSINPIVNCQDTTVYLNASGTYTIDTSYVFANATDNCGIDSIWITTNTFTCVDTGVNTVTVYARDVNNNIDSCQAQVTVLDTINPTALCKDTVVYLDGTGSYVIDSSFIDNGSFDACGISTITLSQTLYNCIDTGTNAVTLYVRDNNGNIDSCTANVTVRDTIPPTVICNDTTVYLDATGQYVIDTSYIFTSASDNCSVDRVWTNDTLYTCANIGTTQATLYVRDASGNIDSCIANVTVMDTIAPTVVCQDTTIYLNASGTYTIDTSYVFVNASDNCGIDSVWITNTSFTCADTGLNIVTIYARDVNNNLDSCQAQVTVLDTVNPTINCQNATVYLDTNGQFIIDTSYVYSSAFAGCGLDSIWILDSVFDCSRIGINTVSVYARDINGNIDSCQAQVTVLDTVTPQITCGSTLYDTVSNSCEYIVPDFRALTLPTDNCTDSINFQITQVPVPGTVITVQDQQIETITITVTDTNGNPTVCMFDVELTCSDEFQIPEFISPNGDGKNDTWIITGIEAYPNNNVKVFNRYGAMVYQTNGYHNQWDGTANVDYIFQSGESDNILPSGTYFYRLELDVNNKQSEVYTGMVQIQK